MLQRLKNLFKKKTKDIILVKRSTMSPDAVTKLAEETGKTVFLVDDVNDVKVISEEVKTGDGKAEFLGSGTEDEWLDQQREDTGLKAWYERIKHL